MTLGRNQSRLYSKRKPKASEFNGALESGAIFFATQNQGTSRKASRNPSGILSGAKNNLARYTSAHTQRVSTSAALKTSARRFSAQIEGGAKSLHLKKDLQSAKRFALRSNAPLRLDAYAGDTKNKRRILKLGKSVYATQFNGLLSGQLNNQPDAQFYARFVPQNVAQIITKGSAPTESSEASNGADVVNARAHTDTSAGTPAGSQGDVSSNNAQAVTQGPNQPGSQSVDLPNNHRGVGGPDSADGSSTSDTPPETLSGAPSPQPEATPGGSTNTTLAPESTPGGASLGGLSSSASSDQSNNTRSGGATSGAPSGGHLLPEKLDDLISITPFTKIGASLRGASAFVKVMLKPAKGLIAQMSEAEIEQFTSARLDYDALKKMDKDAQKSSAKSSAKSSISVAQSPALDTTAPSSIPDNASGTALDTTLDSARNARLEAVRNALENNTIAEEYLREPDVEDISAERTSQVPPQVDVSLSQNEEQGDALEPREATSAPPGQIPPLQEESPSQEDEVSLVETTLEILDEPIGDDVEMVQKGYQIPITSEIPVVRPNQSAPNDIGAQKTSDGDTGVIHADEIGESEVSAHSEDASEVALPKTEDIPIVLALTQQLPIVKVVEAVQNSTENKPAQEAPHESANQNKLPQDAPSSAPDDVLNSDVPSEITPDSEPAREPIKRILSKKRIPSPLALAQAAKGGPDIDDTIQMKPASMQDSAQVQDLANSEEPFLTTEPLPFAPIMKPENVAENVAKNVDSKDSQQGHIHQKPTPEEMLAKLERLAKSAVEEIDDTLNPKSPKVEQEVVQEPVKEPVKEVAQKVAQKVMPEAVQEVVQDASGGENGGDDVAPINTTLPLKTSAIHKPLAKPIRPGTKSPTPLTTTSDSVQDPHQERIEQSRADKMTPDAVSTGAAKKPASKPSTPATDFTMLRKSVSDIMSEIMDDVYGPRRSYKAGTSEIDVPPVRTPAKPKAPAPPPVKISFPSERRALFEDEKSPTPSTPTATPVTRKTNAFSSSILKSSRPLTAASTIPTFGRSKKGDPLAAFEDILSEIDSKTQRAESSISANAKNAISQMQTRFDDVSNPLDAFKRGSK
ncbi:MAG: hypothetical protein LBC50_00395 [Candidatus Ancillula sp.]|jgi:hypothetical protein|nr:hypothetical protein [Candidatus Ancillula sp.]